MHDPPRKLTQAQAESELRSLELFGMRFGLDRMRRMMTALGSPERSFDTIQLLGTNGKSSTTRMTAAILAEHGLRTGTYTSPHLTSYRERVLVAGEQLSGAEFAAAVARASHAATQVNRTLAEDDHVTQFELLTAAALWAMAGRGVEVAAVEAGLGGRYDATSVVDAGVTVLTNVGLEHTRWLGPTVRDIAEEKLAVLAAGGTLVLGAELDRDALAVAERVAAERGASIVTAPADPGLAVAAPGLFQRRNFALARAAARAYLQRGGRELEADAVSRAAAQVHVPGRLQRLDDDPPTLLDGAHNPHAVAALVQSLAEGLPRGAPLGLVMGVLEDKDAASMLEMLLPLCERAWFTAPPSARALPPAALSSLARQLGFDATRSACESQPARALEGAQAWAREAGGAVLATGSVYLVGALLGDATHDGAIAASAAAAAAAGPSSRELRDTLGGAPRPHDALRGGGAR
jgi:dihydrofolate synthase/folylpolyglutamate synthase